MGVLAARFLKPRPAVASSTGTKKPVPGPPGLLTSKDAAALPSPTTLPNPDALDDNKSVKPAGSASGPAFWYRAHRAIQTCGISMAVAGTVIALVRPEFGAHNTTHGDLGLATMVLGLLQPINA